jgi:phosphatidylglycerophosphate synthase
MKMDTRRSCKREALSGNPLAVLAPASRNSGVMRYPVDSGRCANDGGPDGALPPPAPSMTHYPTSFEQFERVCQKPDHRRIGNLMARRVTRPLALRITWLLASWPVHAHTATLGGWACAVGAVVALGLGTVFGWALAAGLLQLWYLLDHVDGQLARLRNTASLDGTQLDYLMHHTVHLLVPVGIGWGVTQRWGSTAWIALGLAAGVSWMLVTLRHDARYKAFFRRLKRLEGELQVLGGGGGRPTAPPPWPSHPLKLAAWAARKSGEMHVAMNLIALLALAGWLTAIEMPWLAAMYLVAIATAGGTVAAWEITREQLRGASEREFAAWFHAGDMSSDVDPEDAPAPKERRLQRITESEETPGTSGH